MCREFLGLTTCSGRYDNEPSWRTKEPILDSAPGPSSNVPLAQDGAEAYLRRLAMSTRPGAPPFAPSLDSAASVAPDPAPVAAPPLAMSGEEAYLRRLAMSAGTAPVPRPPSPEPLRLAPSFSPPVEQEEPAYIPMSPPEAVAAALPAELSAQIKAKREAAAAIAARLSQIAALPQPTPSASSDVKLVTEPVQDATYEQCVRKISTFM